MCHCVANGCVYCFVCLQVPEKQLERRRRAVAALADHSRVVLDQLRDAEDELLAGGCLFP